MRVIKYRGQKFRGGYHDFSILTGGVQVFPRLVSSEHKKDFRREVLSTNNPQMNALMGGGVERGSSVLVLGPAGSGKSFIVMTFIAAAARRGEISALFMFDEELGLLTERMKPLGIDLQELIDKNLLILAQVDAAELTPGEFSQRVRRCIEAGARTIIIDSLNGYQAAMPEEQALILHMHELLQYCNRQGATTFLTIAQHGLMGDMKSPVDLTYLADTVILLRYFEAYGRVRRAISVVKKRTSAHEDTIREYKIDSRGLSLGEPLANFQGVLRGVPTVVGEDPSLLNDAPRRSRPDKSASA
jgi:circadian clock protein KaiC